MRNAEEGSLAGTGVKVGPSLGIQVSKPDNDIPSSEPLGRPKRKLGYTERGVLLGSTT